MRSSRAVVVLRSVCCRHVAAAVKGERWSAGRLLTARSPSSVTVWPLAEVEEGGAQGGCALGPIEHVACVCADCVDNEPTLECSSKATHRIQWCEQGAWLQISPPFLAASTPVEQHSEHAATILHPTFICASCDTVHTQSTASLQPELSARAVGSYESWDAKPPTPHIHSTATYTTRAHTTVVVLV